MAAPSRQTKVLVALLVSIVVGIIILNLLGHNPPSAGAFCLSRYYSLVPVEKAVFCRAPRTTGYWKYIEIYYSGGNSRLTYSSKNSTQQSNSLGNVAGNEGINSHFIVCNGHIGHDGQILPTERWQRQWPLNSQSPNHIQTSTERRRAIYICVLANGKTTNTTQFQIKRTEALVAELCRKFKIPPEFIYYPSGWQ